MLLASGASGGPPGEPYQLAVPLAAIAGIIIVASSASRVMPIRAAIQTLMGWDVSRGRAHVGRARRSSCVNMPGRTPARLGGIGPRKNRLVGLRGLAAFAPGPGGAVKAAWWGRPLVAGCTGGGHVTAGIGLVSWVTKGSSSSGFAPLSGALSRCGGSECGLLTSSICWVSRRPALSLSARSAGSTKGIAIVSSSG